MSTSLAGKSSCSGRAERKKCTSCESASDQKSGSNMLPASSRQVQSVCNRVDGASQMSPSTRCISGLSDSKHRMMAMPDPGGSCGLCAQINSHSSRASGCVLFSLPARNAPASSAMIACEAPLGVAARAFETICVTARQSTGRPGRIQGSRSACNSMGQSVVRTEGFRLPAKCPRTRPAEPRTSSQLGRSVGVLFATNLATYEFCSASVICFNAVCRIRKFSSALICSCLGMSSGTKAALAPPCAPAAATSAIAASATAKKSAAAKATMSSPSSNPTEGSESPVRC
mmetsp:Transcript_28007/g.93034  ORF Transcript_28007/g.93034 Transcript_28007/m.93034 type:complete len:286 (-) Transcript_28007:1657-2514(-)